MDLSSIFRLSFFANFQVWTVNVYKINTFDKFLQIDLHVDFWL